MAAAETTHKPSYLGLLNTISLAESAAGVYLEAWADVTPNEDLACVLRLVAARERSHGDVFCRRIAELGYSLKRKPDPKSAARLAKLADPDISDLEKVGPERANDGDPFAHIRRMVAEGEFDPMTANLMTWYIAEEKDSGRRLDEAFACIRDAASGKKSARKADHRTGADGPSADAEAIMACMTAGFAKLEKSLDKLVRAAK